MLLKGLPYANSTGTPRCLKVYAACNRTPTNPSSGPHFHLPISYDVMAPGGQWTKQNLHKAENVKPTVLDVLLGQSLAKTMM